MIGYFYDENDKLNITMSNFESKIVNNGDIIEINNEKFLFMKDYFYKINLENNFIYLNKLKIYELL